MDHKRDGGIMTFLLNLFRCHYSVSVSLSLGFESLFLCYFYAIKSCMLSQILFGLRQSKTITNRNTSQPYRLPTLPTVGVRKTVWLRLALSFHQQQTIMAFITAHRLGFKKKSKQGSYGSIKTIIFNIIFIRISFPLAEMGRRK